MEHTHTRFDDIARRRLAEVPPSAPDPAGWDRLERALDAPTDAALSAALTGLATTDAVAGWETLAQRLPTAPPAADGRDQALADRLDGLVPEGPARGWAALAHRLDRDNAARVDALVHQQLSGPTAAPASGWAALAARLELIGWRRSTVAAWKVTEGALLLSLLLLLLRFGPQPERGPLAHATPVGVATPSAGVTPPAPGESAPSVPAAPRQPAAAPLRATSPAVVARPEITDRSETGTGEPGVGIVAPADQHGTRLPAEPVPPLAPRPLTMLKLPAPSVPSPALSLARVENAAPVVYYANGFVSPVDLNQVVTPGDAVGIFEITKDRRLTTGYTAGLLLDIEKGRNGLQVGVIYSRRAYVPASLKWRYQDQFSAIDPVRGFESFVYHAVEFPFSYQRTWVDRGRWRVGTRVGMSLSVIAKPEIVDQETVVDELLEFEETVTNLAPVPDQRGLPPAAPNFAGKRQLTEPPRGWLEGGGLLANSSFYLGGGVTVERLLTDRWSVYVSPSLGRVIYLRQNVGVGPYGDRIHLGSLRLGGRYRLGGK